LETYIIIEMTYKYRFRWLLLLEHYSSMISCFCTQICLVCINEKSLILLAMSLVAPNSMKSWVNLQ